MLRNGDSASTLLQLSSIGWVYNRRDSTTFDKMHMKSPRINLYLYFDDFILFFSYSAAFNTILFILYWL
jgi:hypothetical protein